MPTIEARITEVTQNTSTGFYKIKTDHDRIKSMETRIPEKGVEAGGFKKSGQLLQIEFSESQGGLNPRTNKPYDNRYYERAAPIDEPEPEPEDDGIERITPTRAPTDPMEAWRISLSAGAKLAVATIPYLEKKPSFEEQRALAFAWGKYLYYTPLPEATLDDLVANLDPEAEGIPF